MGVLQRLDFPPTRQPILVDWFIALVSDGPLEGQGRFELLDGEIYRMSPQYARHSTVTRQLANLLEAAVIAANLDLQIFSPISVQLNETSMPEPDIVVARPRLSGAVPIEEMVMAVEVSDASLAHDLKRKAESYARGKVAEYWVVDLPNGRLHQMTEPTPKGYATIEVHPFGARVASKIVPQILVDTSRIA